MISRKVAAVAPDERLAAHEGWRDVEVRWVVSAYETGSRLGSVAWIDVPPGASYEVHRHPECERIVYVFEGGGSHLGSGGFEMALSADDAVLVRPGQWHGFSNDTVDPARLVVVYAPAARIADALYEAYDISAPALEGGNDVVRVSGSETREDPDLRDDQGFIDLHVKWLVNAEQAGSEHMLFGLSRFGPKGTHVLHRHPHAEEVCYVIEGEGGVQLTADGEFPIEPGELTFGEEGEWHGHVAGDEGMRFIFLYMGAPSLAAAEYELHDPDEARRLAEVARARQGG